LGNQQKRYFNFALHTDGISLFFLAIRLTNLLVINWHNAILLVLFLSIEFRTFFLYIHSLQNFIIIEKQKNKVANLANAKKAIRVQARKSEINKKIRVKAKRLLKEANQAVENKDKKTWNNEEEFWIDCAKLQKDGKFASSEYWYTLNDLFKGLYTIFLISSIIAFVTCKIGLGFIFTGLFLICHFRAIQFADYFVKTVKRFIKW